MEINHKEIDLVPFSMMATNIDYGCPFYVGNESRFTRKDGAWWQPHQRYCMGMRAVATYIRYGNEVILTGCCCRFGKYEAVKGMKSTLQSIIEKHKVTKKKWKRAAKKRVEVAA